MNILSCQNSCLDKKLHQSFKGTTRIFAVTDSHQETRKECAFLTKVQNDAKKYNNIMLLNGGDLFKGIYPRELEVESYLNLKSSSPNLKVVMTLGNNDFGFDKEGLDFLENTVKDFQKNGINVVCANVYEKSTNKRPDWLQPYTIIESDGDRIFVTGFCLNGINNKSIKAKDSKDVLRELKQDILKENPNGLIIINHDYFASSEELIKFAKGHGLNVDLLIGGHEHDKLKPNEDLHIYYPEAFNNTMYKLDLVINNGKSEIKDVEEISSSGLEIAPEFEEKLVTSEKKTGLFDIIAPYVLDLKKSYINPSPFGTFLADAMKIEADTDIAFFSTGFLMSSMRYKKGCNITNYDFKKTMSADTPIKKVTLNTYDLKSIFENALQNRMIKEKANAKFLQCSQNIKLEGIGNRDEETYKLKQIYINDEPLLDENGAAINADKTYTCAIDAFIAMGGQGFSTLQALEKESVMKNGKEVKINEVLTDALKEAPLKYQPGDSYPQFELTDLKEGEATELLNNN